MVVLVFALMCMICVLLRLYPSSAFFFASSFILRLNVVAHLAAFILLFAVWTILAAARVYEVSVDFLFGITDDWEVGVPRGTQAWMLDAWERMRQRDLLALDMVHREVVSVCSGIGGILSGVSELSAAICVYRTRNPQFEETLGSATVIHRVAKLEAAARDAEADLKRFRLGRFGEAA